MIAGCLPDEEARIDRVIVRLREAGAYELACTIARVHGVRLRDVLGRRRPLRFVRPRHDLWRLFRNTTGWSYPDMSETFEVDHTTILTAVNRVEACIVAIEEGT